MKREKSLQGFKLRGGVLLVMAASGVLLPHLAMANTAAGTVLRNNVSVTYQDNAATPNNYSASSSVDVAVDLVGSVAWGSAPTGQTVGQGDNLESPYYQITLTNQGNGSDTFTLLDSTSESCTGPGSLTAQSFTLGSPLTLGATVSAGAAQVDTPVAGQSTIPVSNLVDSDFANGDTVIINGNAYVVESALDDNDGTTTDTLVVVGDASADVAAAGVPIGERITVTYGASGTSGTLGSAADVCQHDHELEATGLSVNGNTAANDVVNGWATVIEAVDVVVTKYVRNSTPLTTKNPGAGGVQYNGAGPLYFTSGVTGNPGDTLEYLVVIENTSNADAENVVFNDTLPAFTAYSTGTLAVDTDGNGTFDRLVTAETEGVTNGGIIKRSGQNIDVYPGVGGNEAAILPALPGGTVADNSKTAVRYTITIE